MMFDEKRFTTRPKTVAKHSTVRMLVSYSETLDKQQPEPPHTKPFLPSSFVHIRLNALTLKSCQTIIDYLPARAQPRSPIGWSRGRHGARQPLASPSASSVLTLPLGCWAPHWEPGEIKHRHDHWVTKGQAQTRSKRQWSTKAVTAGENNKNYKQKWVWAPTCLFEYSDTHVAVWMQRGS